MENSVLDAPLVDVEKHNRPKARSVGKGSLQKLRPQARSKALRGLLPKRSCRVKTADLAWVLKEEADIESRYKTHILRRQNDFF